MKFLSSAIAIILVSSLAASPAWSQVGASPAVILPASPLRIQLLDSDGSRVAANTRTAKGVSVQVTDTNGTPVGDAAVAFRFPETGSSASFADGSRSIVAYTDAGGRAQIANFQWNDTPGTVALRVTASKANSHAGLLVEQEIMNNAPVSAPVAVKPVPVPGTEAEAAIPETKFSATPTLKPAAAVAADSQMPSEYVASPFRLPRPNIAPMVSISSTGRGDHDMVYHGSNKKKWIMLGVLAGVGAGIAFAVMNAKTGTAAAASSGVSVGTPTISIGHP